jgi:hypothetical protein
MVRRRDKEERWKEKKGYRNKRTEVMSHFNVVKAEGKGRRMQIGRTNSGRESNKSKVVN